MEDNQQNEQHKRTGDAIGLILQERSRQRNKEGFDDDNDDKSDNGQLATLASFYSMPDDIYKFFVSHNRDVNNNIKFETEISKQLIEPVNWCKREGHSRLNLLSKAGALIIAEMERIMREEKK